jgi:hypothetical protein
MASAQTRSFHDWINFDSTFRVVVGRLPRASNSFSTMIGMLPSLMEASLGSAG